SWHPWMIDSKPVLPVQQDETALVVWALRQHFLAFRDVEFIKGLYVPLVINPAMWMLEHRDHNGLPKPSWDLWEERRGVHTFTVAATIAGLNAAADFARDMGAMDHSAEFREGADRMRGAMMRHLWVKDKKRFARSAIAADDGGYTLDMTTDAANYAIFAFGVLEADHPAVIAEMTAIRERLWVNTRVGGVARYERDYYHQVERQDIQNVPGNPWIICTLWLAQHQIAVAKNVEQLQKAIEILEWVRDRAMPSGVLAEQLHPYTGAPMSVSPLTWSHASVMTVVMQYLTKHAQLSGKSHALTTPLTMPTSTAA
ncbi:MAG TPA: glycoside hydrolase family 15 protein, partial [Phycisphaerales bacterium]|nr:glycoside hydrolase family 15 protein [Phycisphaerales bacterium]